MPNLAQLLKSEITRLARKQVRDEVAALRKATLAHRSDIAELKRTVHAMQQEVRRLNRTIGALAPRHAESGEADTPRLRFSAKGLRTQRERLGLTANECGQLIGVSGQSVYLWESGRAKPRPKLLPAIAALRTMGKKEAAERLEALG